MITSWKKMMRQLKLENTKSKSPSFFELSGGYSMIVKPYNDTTSNGLTRCIIDFLQFKDHYANRISTQCQARAKAGIPRYDIFNRKMVTIGGGITWTKGSTRKGTPDVDAIIDGMPAKIEVKIGGDTMSDDQDIERAKIENAGGHYFIARDFPSFLTWYDETFVQV